MSHVHELTVEHTGQNRFTVEIRGHEVGVDQPRAGGGSDTAPTPTELFAAALASCVAYYARRYLTRHNLPDRGLAVTASYTMAERPIRIGTVSVRVAVPDSLTEDQRRALLAVASRCTVHNTLRQPPDITIELSDAPTRLRHSA